MDIGLTIFLGLAVWRVTRMLNSERGPFDIFERFRARLARRQKRMGGMFDMISCFACVSVWTSVIPALALAHNPLTFIGFVLVLSTEAIFLNKVFDNLR